MFYPLSFIFLVFIVFPTYGQINFGEVEYAIVLGELPEPEPEPDKKDVIHRMFEVSQQYVERMTAILKFDRSKALFKLKDGMAVDRKPYYNFSKVMVGLDKVYLTEADSNKLVIRKEAFNEWYIIKEKTKGTGEWKISSAYKMIDGFKVFKATTTEVTENSKGKFKYEVVAWFAPEIPFFGYGPVGYGGLPGLILELQINRSYLPMTYKLKSIKFSNKALEIKYLEGKEISREALDALYKKATANIIKSK
ncbi:GLPGLI family protein [Zunongwangia profunda]|uniref:GLPGLI family protein n=1 Tax=Zunongwangia profunda TaxID=398743 RepID=UPI00031D9A39|nr:GLPGLI family protein [Zunongwangia profunda]